MRRMFGLPESAAQSVEDAEIEYWCALLSYLPSAETVLDTLQQDMLLTNEEERPQAPQVLELKTLMQTYRKQRSKLHADQMRDWTRLCVDLAREIRLPDTDRLWVANAFRVVRDIVKPPPLGEEPRMVLPETPAYKRFMQRVRRSDVMQREAKNKFVKANLRLVVSIARRYNRGRLPLIA